MELFTLLLGKIIPLYAIIGLGFFAGQKLKIPKEPVATIAIYLLVPVVFFGASAQLHIQKEYFLLPLMLFALSTAIGLGIYKLAGLFWQDGRKNIIGYTMGTANQGYFGIPVFLALFGPEHLGLYVFVGLGFSLYEGSVGYYLMARGSYTIKDSLIRLLRLPLIPAVIVGLCFSAAGLQLSPGALEFYTLFKGAYTVLGMMLIGLSLSQLHHLKSDMKFTSFIMACKFILWPLAGVLFLFIYQWLTGPAAPIVRQIILLLSALPLAANAVAFAAQLRVEPDKAATVVILSTLIALFFIPLLMTLAS